MPVVTTAPDSRSPRFGAAGWVALAIALAAAIAPLPPDVVERAYSHGLYPRLQRVISSVSAASPIALLDPAAALLLAIGVLVCVRRYRAFGWRSTVSRMLRTGLVTAAIIYLWFLFFWGFNYRRVPLEQKLAYNPSQITREQGLQLGRTAVERAHALVP